MSLFQLRRISLVLLGVAAVLGAATAAQATPITFSGSYDGSYDPYSAPPPAGQSTWLKGTATIVPVPNDDNGTVTPGVANFNDLSTTARASAYRLMGTGTFQTDQSLDEYTYSGRLKFYLADVLDGTQPQANVCLGFRDEFRGSGDYGKVVMLGWIYNNTADGNQPGLWLVDGNTGCYSGKHPNNTTYYGTKINNVNYFDDAFHTYRVDKFIDTADNVTKVKVYVDEVQVGSTVLYSSLNNAPNGNNGFGYFSGTKGTARVTVDNFEYGPLVPEPSTLVLLATGLIGLLAYAWRKRK